MPLASGQPAQVADDNPAFAACEVPHSWQKTAALSNHHGSVLYRTSFDGPRRKPAGRRYASLVLEGAAYKTKVHLNGARVGQEEAGYFHRRMWPVTDLLARTNTLDIEVTCDRELDVTRKRQVLGVFTHWDMLPRDLNVGGLWGPVALWWHGPVVPVAARCRVDRIEPGPRGTEGKPADGDEVHLFVEVELRAHVACQTALDIELTAANHDGPGVKQRLHIRVPKGASRRIVALTVQDARLWWPKGFGAPHLYDVKATAHVKGHAAEQCTARTGLRTVHMDEWMCHVNERRVFLRGSNLAPVAPYLDDMTPARFERVLDLAEAAHFNMLRVHAHVPPAAFFRAADERGLLIWQDMPLQWLYEPTIMAEIRRQGRRLVDHIANHPSVFMVCCANEPVYMEDTSKVSLKQAVMALVNHFGPSYMRDDIAEAVQRELSQKDPSRFYLRSSGEMDTPLAEGEDTHLYQGWYPVFGPPERLDWFLGRWPNNARFVSEFGAQSWPDPPRAVTFTPEDPADIDKPAMRAQHFAQFENIDLWLDVDACQNATELAEISQQHQVRVCRWFIDRLRMRRFAPCGGFTQFAFNEPIVGVTWSIVDGTLSPKRSFAPIANSLRPANAFVLPGETKAYKDTVYPGVIWAVNDRADDVSLHIHAAAFDLDGTCVAERSGHIDVPADGPALEAFGFTFMPKKEGSVRIELTVTEGDDTWTHRYVVEVMGPTRKKLGRVKPGHPFSAMREALAAQAAEDSDTDAETRTTPVSRGAATS